MNLSELRDLYKRGVNIIDYLWRYGITRSEAIEISYDLQAGTYIQFANEHPEYVSRYTSQIADAILDLNVEIGSLMEAGVGEATTLASVVDHLGNSVADAGQSWEQDVCPEGTATGKARMASDSLQLSTVLGFDISWSRIKFAERYLRIRGTRARLFVADLFSIPLMDNAVDVVYTSHSIEPNGGRERVALEELYRITRKYLILFEPSYEFADQKGRRRMESLGYVKDLAGTAAALGMRVLRHQRVSVFSNPLNPTAILVVEKNRGAPSNPDPQFICRETNEILRFGHNCYWGESSLRCFPVISGIPVLTEKAGIIATHAEQFLR